MDQQFKSKMATDIDISRVTAPIPGLAVTYGALVGRCLPSQIRASAEASLIWSESASDAIGTHPCPDPGLQRDGDKIHKSPADFKRSVTVDFLVPAI